MRAIEYILPANWTTIELTEPLGAQVDELSRRMFAGAPNEAEQARRSVAARLRSSLEEAKAKGAIQMWVEAEPAGGVRSGASLTLMPFPEDNDDPMSSLVAVASQTPGAVVLEAGDLVVLRTLAEEDATSDTQEAVDQLKAEVSELQEQDLGSLRVKRRSLTYYVGHPDYPEDWMVLMGQVMVDASQEAGKLADAVVAMCDAIVGSVRFA